MTDKVWHVELVVDDKHAAAKYYADLFGWQVEHFEEMDYIQVRSGAADPTLAFSAINTEQGVPPGGVLVYVDVADIDATLAKAGEVGGTVVMEKMDIANVGTMSMIADPHGNRVAVMQRAYTVPSTTIARVNMLAEQIKSAAQVLQGTMQGVTAEIAQHSPGGTANSIAANLGHVVTSVDGVVNGLLKGSAPVLMTMETGLSAPPPTGEDTFNWHEWGKSLTIDLEKFHVYTGKVFESVEQYMGSISDSDLDTVHQTPVGERTTFAMLNGAVLANLSLHAGEISALKGQQNLKGYPF